MNEELRELLNQFHEALGKADALKDKIYEQIEELTNESIYDITSYIEDDLNYVFGIDEDALEEYLNEHKGE